MELPYTTPGACVRGGCQVLGGSACNKRARRRWRACWRVLVSSYTQRERCSSSIIAPSLSSHPASAAAPPRPCPPPAHWPHHHHRHRLVADWVCRWCRYTNDHRDMFIPRSCTPLFTVTFWRTVTAQCNQTVYFYTALSLAAQCIVIGPVCGWVCGCVCGSITRNCVHRSSPNWVCRWW